MIIGEHSILLLVGLAVITVLLALYAAVQRERRIMYFDKWTIEREARIRTEQILIEYRKTISTQRAYNRQLSDRIEELEKNTEEDS